MLALAVRAQFATNVPGVIAYTNVFGTNAIAWSTNNPAFASNEHGYVTNNATAFATVSTSGVTNNSAFGYKGADVMVPLGSSITDTDAISFIYRATVLSLGTQVAVQNLVSGLKSAGIWTNLVAFYPLLQQQSFTQNGIQGSGFVNSVSPNLLATNYPIVWFPNWTFTSQGATGNGYTGTSTNGIADTGYSPGVQGAPTNNWHIFAWVSSASLLANTNYFFGSGQINPKRSSFFTSNTNGAVVASLLTFSNQPALTCPVVGGGAFLCESVTNTLMLFYGNGSSVSTNFTAVNHPLATYNLETAANISSFTLGSSALVNFRALSFGYGLTAVQVTNYFAIVQNFESAIGRGTP